MMKQERGFQLDFTEAFPHLPDAPIAEAVIHWRARSEKPAQPDELREQLAEQLPQYPKCQNQQELQLEAQFSADGSSTQTRRDSWRGFRFTSSDRLHIAQFNRDGLVFWSPAAVRELGEFFSRRPEALENLCGIGCPL